MKNKEMLHQAQELKKFLLNLLENTNEDDDFEELLEKFFQGLPVENYIRQGSKDHLGIYFHSLNSGNFEHAAKVLNIFIKRYEKIWRA